MKCYNTVMVLKKISGANNPFRTPSHNNNMNSIDVLTIGAATRDVFIQSARFKTVKDASAPDGFDTCFPLGSKIDLDNITFETGGGATNAAVTFSRFGLKTSCAARIGNDVGGQEILERLKKDGVGIETIQRDTKNNTGYSLILLSDTGHRAILVFRGASNLLDADEIAWKTLSPKWIYLTSISGNEVALKKIFSSAKKLNTHVAWNPGNSEINLGLKKLTPWILQSDIVNLNREEAASLADVPPRHLESILHRLGSLPRQALIVTDGQHGAYVHSRGIAWFAPAIPGKRVNTTGAGDAFGSAFTAAAIKTGKIETAARVAMLNAYGVITHMGAKAGILKKFPAAAEMKRVKLKKI
jgi:ribokinase